MISMISLKGWAWIAFASGVVVSACSPSGGAGNAAGSGGAGRSAGTGGGAATGTGGGAPGTGGGTSASGGSLGIGGTASPTGGAPGSGGTVSATGGASGTGGTVSAIGGSIGAGASFVGVGGMGGGMGGRMGNGGNTGGAGMPVGGGAQAGAGARGTGGSIGTGGTPAACAAPMVTAGTPATVTVDLGAAPLGTVSPDLIGVHTAVYDGLLTTTPTTPQLLKAAGVTSLRYPGGSYADLYHWESNTGTATPAAGAGSNVIYVAPTANFGAFVSLMQSAGANALITVNYGMNPAGTGPGVPEEAAAWVAYANGSATNTMPIGTDANGRNWMTVGYWAGLRAAARLAVDDGLNFLRISRPQPVGIKYWEIGNELYGNGFYQGSATSAGWEADLHAPYNGTNGTARRNNPLLASSVYGMGVKAFSAAMKAVDPTVHIGGVVNYPDTAFAGFNSGALSQGCASMDFAVAHWYAGGAALTSLLTVARTTLPTIVAAFRSILTAPANGCGAKGATMPIAITEWGPNTFQAGIGAALTAMPQTGTQIAGIFAAESYATFMEQGIVSAHWAQLHDPSYLGATSTDSGYGYHGALIAHYLAAGGDAVLPQPSVANAGALMTLLFAHASLHADGTVAVMLTNTSPNTAAAVTVNVTGGATILGCSGFRYAYAPVNTNLDGPVTTQPIFSAPTGTSFSVAVPAYGVVVVAFPPK